MPLRPIRQRRLNLLFFPGCFLEFFDLGVFFSGGKAALESSFACHSRADENPDSKSQKNADIYGCES